MKAFNRFWIWFGTPAILAAAVLLDSQQLAQVGAMLMWVIALSVGTLCTLTGGLVLAMTPAHANWAESRDNWLKNKRGMLATAVSWVSLAIAVFLAAYLGFLVTAVFYCLSSLWTRIVVWLVETHFNKAETAQP